VMQAAINAIFHYNISQCFSSFLVCYIHRWAVN
jgi:hypothetical protein